MAQPCDNGRVKGNGSEGDSLLQHGHRWFNVGQGYNGLVATLIMTKMFTNVANRVVQKIMLVPMQPFAYIVANTMAFVYVIVYGCLLMAAYAFGYVAPGEGGLWSDNLLGIPKRRLILIGACDTIGSVLTTIAASRLAGPSIVVLGQAILPASMIISHLVLRTTYSRAQMASVGLVVTGVAIATVPGYQSNTLNNTVPIFFSVLMVLAMLPYALSFTLKEQVFRERPNLPVLVVNFFSSLFQLCFSVLCLPIVSLPQFGGIPMNLLPSYVRLAAECVASSPYLQLISPVEVAGELVVDWTQCQYMPTPLLLYIVINITMNILVLVVVKHAGAVLNFVVGTVATTLQYFAFVIDWPLLPKAHLASGNYIGFGCSLAGLIVYRLATIQKERDASGAPAKPSRC